MGEGEGGYLGARRRRFLVIRQQKICQRLWISAGRRLVGNTKLTSPNEIDQDCDTGTAAAGT